jgi:O-methyltransferase
MKRVLKALVGSVGYEIRRMPAKPSDPDSIAAQSVKDSQYYARWSSSVPIYMPWLEDERFSCIYRTIAEQTVVSIDRCYLLYCFATHAANLAGNFAECGVYKGGTAFLLSEAATATKTVHLFDAFAGLPNPEEGVDNYYQAGVFADTNIEKVRQLLHVHAGRTRIHEGWMPETFENVEDETFSLVHVDVDLYRTAKACCEFFFPRLCKGGILIFDDYGFPACRGEREAVDEFFSMNLEKPICMPTGQAIAIKL